MARKPLSEALQRLLSRLDGSYPDGGFILIGMPDAPRRPKSPSSATSIRRRSAS